MLNLALGLLALSAFLVITVGIRYLRCEVFMPYHATVAGKSWAELDPGIQTLLLGLLKVNGGGLASLAITILWLCLAIRDGVWWAPWAILTISAVALGATLFAAVTLRSFRPDAKTPVGPVLMLIALIVVGTGLSMIA